MDLWRADRLAAVQARIERFYLGLFRHRVAVLFAVGVFCLAGLAGLPKLQVNNSIDVWFSEKAPSYTRYREFSGTFGSDEYLFVALDFGDLFTDTNLSALTRMSDAFACLPGVVEITGLPTATDIRGTADGAGGSVRVEEMRERFGVEPADAIRRRILSDERYVRKLVSPAGDVAVLLLRFTDPRTGCFQIPRVEKILRETAVPFHLGGYIFAQYEMDRMTHHDYFLFGSICLAVLTVIFAALFRDVRLTLIFIADCVLTVGVVLGWMGHFGVPIHLMTGILPPLLMAMAVANDIHLVDRYLRGPDGDESAGSDLVARSARSSADVTIPGSLSMLTTFAGFFSLSGGAVPALADFGFWSGIGIVFTFLFSFIVVPTILTYVTPPCPRPGGDSGPGLTGIWLVELCSRFRRPFIVIFFALCVLAVFGIRRIVVDTQLTNFFMSESRFMKSMDFIEERFGNTGPLEIVLVSDTPDGLKRPETLVLADRLMARLSAAHGIDTAISINPVLKSLTRALMDDRPDDSRLPERSDLLEQELLVLSLSPSGEDTLNRFVNSSWTQFRIQARLPRMTNNEALELFDRIEVDVREVFGPDQRFYLTGVVEAYSRLDRFILESQLKSLGITLASVALVFWLQVGRPLWALLALLPNVFPIILMFATMGWTGLTLNVATATVAAITLGLADDDTVYFFYAYLRRRRTGMTAREALPGAVSECGRALWVATLLNVAGFSIFVFSSFRPTVYFGFLTSEVWVLGILAEFLLLPALLLTFDRK